MLQELEKIVEKLKNPPTEGRSAGAEAKYMEDFDIKIINESSSNKSFILVKHKEKPTEQKFVYNPEVFKDNDDICFKIFYNKGYLWNECNMNAYKYDGNDDNWSEKLRFSTTNDRGSFASGVVWDNLKYCPKFSDITGHRQEIILQGEVDIPAIIKYINDTEYTILIKRRDASTYVPYNYPIICQNCEKCRNNKKLNYL